MDHFFQIEMLGPPEHEMFEAYTALAYAAAVTEPHLGTLVTGVTYRHPHPGQDRHHAGRALRRSRYLGVGAAWNEEEHRGWIAYQSLGERFERLDETLPPGCSPRRLAVRGEPHRLDVR